MSKSKKSEVVSQIDQYREAMTELRLKVLGNLEARIKSDEIDSTEALTTLAAILLFSRQQSLDYAKIMGDKSLWRRAS